MYFYPVRFTQTYNPAETYFIEQLKTEDESIENTLKRLKEAEQQLLRYRQQVSNRASEVLQLEYVYFVDIRRYERNRINYDVRLIKTIKEKELKYFYNDKQMLEIEYFNFTGKERKQALEKAEELSKKYNCSIVKNF